MKLGLEVVSIVVSVCLRSCCGEGGHQVGRADMSAKSAFFIGGCAPRVPMKLDLEVVSIASQRQSLSVELLR